MSTIYRRIQNKEDIEKAKKEFAVPAITKHLIEGAEIWTDTFREYTLTLARWPSGTGAIYVRGLLRWGIWHGSTLQTETN